MKSDAVKIKELEKKISKLEKALETQRQLIEVLRTLPGNKGVKLKDDKKGKKKNAVPKITKRKSGSVAIDGPLREPADSGRSAGDLDANAEVVEDLSAPTKQ